MSTTLTENGNENESKNEAQESREQVCPQTNSQRTFVPRVDIVEGEDGLVLYADLPGVKPEDVNIHFENRELTIHGKVCPRYGDVQLMHNEYSIGDFHRTFSIGEAIDAEKISAEISGGVLKLHLPKSEKVKPKRIAVKAK